MVLESLLSPKKAERRPSRLFFLGMLYASIGTFLALWIFKNQASLVLVFLTVMASVPLIYNIIKYEERIDIKFKKESKILKHHSRALMVFMLLFAGFVMAFTMWYIFLPEKLVQSTFNAQIETIRSINSRVVGGTGLDAAALVDTSAVSKGTVFMQIFSNNLKVMLFSIFFSFFYGAGAIFILTWNASVIAAAIGNVFRTKIAEVATSSGLANIGNYFGVFALGICRYIFHGTFEILAYFVAGLAGGLISVAVIRHNFGTKNFRKVITDSLDLIIISIVLVFIAGLIEVYISPSIC